MLQRLSLDAPTHSEKSWKLAYVTVATLTVAVALIVRDHFMIDDAYITFRYSYNLAHAHQFVFNLGEPVEGATNLLWAVLLAPLTLLPVSIETAALCVALPCLAWTTLRAMQIGRVLGLGPPGALAATALLSTNLDFLRIATNGLEAALYAALLAEVMYRFLRGEWLLAFLAAALLFMTRPEGLVFGVILLAGGLLMRNGNRQLLQGGAVWLVVLVAVTVWRVVTYGVLVPNSIMAKSVGLAELVHGCFGVIYILRFWATSPQLPVIAGAAAALLLFGRFRANARSVAACIALCGIAFSFAVAMRNNGDWMPYHRLLSQYVVLYSLLAAWLLSELAVRIDRRRDALLAAGALACIAVSVFRDVAILLTPPAPGDQMFRDFYAEAARRLPGVLRADDRISAEGIGWISYHLIGIRFHDPLGLMDPYIARHGKAASYYGKEDPGYTLGIVAPQVALWNWAGHLRPAGPALLAGYRIYCQGNCNDGWNMRIIMVRNDRADDIGAVFADLPQVHLSAGRLTATN